MTLKYRLAKLEKIKAARVEPAEILEVEHEVNSDQYLNTKTGEILTEKQLDALLDSMPDTGTVKCVIVELQRNAKGET